MTRIDETSADETAAHVALRSLALKASGMSGADIERLVREARQKARREKRSLVFSDIAGILASGKPERPREIRWRMAIHEAGHAVVRLSLGIGTVTAISIDSQNGGYIASEMPALQDETEELFGAMLVTRLAGRAAEDELLGSVTAGAGGTEESDLARSTELALAMETALGFGRDQPLLYVPVGDRSSLLAYNPLLAKRVNARLEEAYGSARDLIRRNGDAVRCLADALMRHDTLEEPELAAALAEVRRRMDPPPAPG